MYNNRPISSPFVSCHIKNQIYFIKKKQSYLLSRHDVVQHEAQMLVEFWHWQYSRVEKYIIIIIIIIIYYNILFYKKYY